MNNNTPVNPQPEDVLTGTLFALPALIVAVVATLILNQANLISAISALLASIAAVYLYEKGAGSPPIKGRWIVAAIVVASIIVSVLTMVGSDLAEAYDYLTRTEGELLISKSKFITENLFNSEVLSADAQNIGMTFLFGALGGFGAIRTVFANHKQHKTALKNANTPPKASPKA